MRTVDLDTEDLEVVRHAGGWHSQLVVTSSTIRPGARRAFRVRWRDGQPRCCPTQRLDEWGSDAAPVLNFDARQDGGIMPDYRQCGGCGSMISAPVRITELRPIDAQ